MGIWPKELEEPPANPPMGANGGDMVFAAWGATCCLEKTDLIHLLTDSYVELMVKYVNMINSNA